MPSNCGQIINLFLIYKFIDLKFFTGIILLNNYFNSMNGSTAAWFALIGFLSLSLWMSILKWEKDLLNYKIYSYQRYRRFFLFNNGNFKIFILWGKWEPKMFDSSEVANIFLIKSKRKRWHYFIDNSIFHLNLNS